jgi:hypothetical protein
MLAKEGRLDGYPKLPVRLFESRANVSERTLRHELEVMDVKASFHRAIASASGLSLAEFSTWPRLHEFEVVRPEDGRPVPVRPDGFVRISEAEADGGNTYDAFLELDRSSEVQEILISKAIAYLNYYKSGGFAERNGGPGTSAADFPFRVLMVLKSVERRNNIAARLAESIPPILRHTWLTTFAEVVRDPLGPIWIRPVDYRDATANTPFRHERLDYHPVYRRQHQRDILLESKLVKRRLLEE